MSTGSYRLKTDATNEEILHRLENIERLLVQQDAHARSRMAAWSSWAMLWWLVVGHSAVSILLLVVSSNDDIPIVYGSYLGSVLTLGVWHGLSLRPFQKRWHRTLAATFAGIVISAVALESEIDDMLPMLAFQMGFVGVPAILAAHMTRKTFGCGIAPPLETAVQPSGLKLSSWFLCLTIAAVVLAFSKQVLQWFEAGDPATLASAPIYLGTAALTACLIACTMILWARRTHVMPLIIVALLAWLGILMINCGFVLCLSLVTEENGWAFALEFLSKQSHLIAALSVLELLMPCATAIVLWNSGHRIEFSPKNEQRPASDD